MDEATIQSALASCEPDIAAGRRPDLRASGFWRAVAAAKRDPALAARYGDRIAAVDRAAFARRVRIRMDAAVGAVLLGLVSAVGVLLLGAAAAFDHPWRELVLLAGAGALDGATHGLAHFIVGSLLGIGFSDWFIAPPKPPGFKVDYASYLSSTPARRAWMHAAGAIVTKVVPFLIAPYATVIRCDGWAIATLLVIGVLQLVTDVLFSVRASDWMKFRREMAFVRSR